MKKIIIPCLLLSGFIYTGCHKPAESGQSTDDFTATEQIVLNDFTNNLALNQYLTLSINATKLNTALTNLNATTTDANLAIAQQAWKDMRTVWEQSEGYLFGPVEDKDYDPNMDTWPTDYVQLDSVLQSSNPLTVSDIQGFTLSLRGYHPIEYIPAGSIYRYNGCAHRYMRRSGWWKNERAV